MAQPRRVSKLIKSPFYTKNFSKTFPWGFSILTNQGRVRTQLWLTAQIGAISTETIELKVRRIRPAIFNQQMKSRKQRAAADLI